MLHKNELIEVVTSDLHFLREEWDETVEDHSLRRSSTVLRRLLVENELQRAWKAAGFEREPMINASTLKTVLQTVLKERIIFAAAGGARYKGMELRGILMTNYAMSESEIKQHNTDGLPEEVFGLRAFIEAPCIVIKGHEVSRRVLIKFVTNKLGGAHFDPKRGKDSKESLFPLLDCASKEIMLADKNAVYFELLSAGQAIVSSNDIIQFCEKCK